MTRERVAREKMVKFHKSSLGTVGCTVGLAPHLFVGAYGASPADALSQAGMLAAQLQALADQHPEVSQAIALVPGGSLALKSISAAAALYHSGASVKDVTDAIGPKVANVVKGILSLF